MTERAVGETDRFPRGGRDHPRALRYLVLENEFSGGYREPN